jgi:hypothetical protein
VPKKIIVLSSAAALGSFRGHSYNYHRAVRESLKLASIEYKVLIPQNNPIIDRDDLWETSLRVPVSLVGNLHSKFLRLINYIYYSLCIAVGWILFYRKFSKNAEVIVFYETGGNFLNEALISFVLKILGKKPYAVWYLIRGFPDTKKFQYLLNMSIFLAELFAGRGKLILCTDTVLLQDHLRVTLKKNVSSLPIPHACNKSSDHQEKEEIGLDEIKIWGLSCAGENKGEQYFANLLKNTDRPCDAQFFVRSTFLEKNKIPRRPYINVISSELDAERFVSLLHTCNIVLLPYFGGEGEAYKLSSSGIFVDAVTAGLLPLVTKDTWMEYELNRFNLNELVVDWSKYTNPFDLCALINRLICAKNTMRKLDDMRHSYATFHTPNGFLKALYQYNFLPLNDFEKSQKSMSKS